MANLRDIRNRISSIQNTQKITKAMQMVAAAKLRKAQNRMNATRPFAGKVQEVVARLVKSVSADKQPLLRVADKPQKVLFIVIGSDRGLCGGFNNNLFKEVEETIATTYSSFQEHGTLELICIGRKASGYFPKRGYKVVDKHNGFFDNLAYVTTSAIMNKASELFKQGVYDKVVICYNEFKSVITQNRIVKLVLPIKPDNMNIENPDDIDELTDYIYEPDSENILDKLLPLYLNMQLWRAVLESNAAEQGARMTAMDSATENAKELEEDLKLEYNQARQSAITTEISEIVSGAQALEEA